MPPEQDRGGPSSADQSWHAQRNPSWPATTSNDTLNPPLSLLSTTTTTAAANGHDRILPPLSSITRAQHLPPPRTEMADLVGQSTPPPPWSATSPLTSHPNGFASPAFSQQQAMDSPGTMDLDTGSNSVASAASPDTRTDQRAASVNLDDPDVRLAAEALGDLRSGKGS